MLDNLNWWEIGVLLLLALLIFGDRLPNVISDGLRMVRNLRNMARNATGDLSRELGTDIQLEDLHPKAFIRKHLLSEEDEQAIRKPLQGVDNLRADVTGVHEELKEVADRVDPRAAARKSTATSTAPAPAPAPAPATTTPPDPSARVAAGAGQRPAGLRPSGLPSSDSRRTASRSATWRSAFAAGASGADSTIGVPASPPSRTRVSIGI